MDGSKGSTLDKESIKRIIVQLRAEDKSFQEISDILLKDYGILRTRQAVQGIFSRVMNASEDNLDDLVVKLDIWNLYQLGYNKEQIIGFIQTWYPGKPITLYKLQMLVENSSNNLKSIENEQLKLINKGLKQGLDCDDIKAWLSYKSVDIKDTRFKELLKKNVTLNLEEHIKDEAAKIMELTGDREIAKQIASKFGIELKSKDINRAINKL